MQENLELAQFTPPLGHLDPFTREWKKKTNAPHISFVSDRDKTLIWKDVLVHFMLQIDGYDDIIDGDELKERVRDWAMKKMAT